MEQEKKMRGIRAIIRGRVQMVMYRDFAQRKARGLGIVGTVRNLDDGTVEVRALGTPEVIARYVEKLSSGPTLARVDAVDVEPLDAVMDADDFVIVY